MLKKMVIYALNDQGQQDQSKKITLQVNPSTITENFSIEYAKDDSLNNTGSESQFNRVGPHTLKFKVTFDGTGVIDDKSVSSQIKDLIKLCYTYNGDKHEPNKVLISWGDLSLKALLKGLNITYKLFSPDGNPLRAELDLDFSEYIPKKEEIKNKNEKSPDITHVFQIQAGTNLPSLCRKVYRNSKLYLEIARINNLTDFRYIKPGTKIFLPPLK